MKDNIWTFDLISWIFGIAVFATGLLNIFLVHPVPGVVYMLLSFVYFPPANALLRKKSGFLVPPPVKIMLGIVIILFTFGVSDLGDMFD